MLVCSVFLIAAVEDLSFSKVYDKKVPIATNTVVGFSNSVVEQYFVPESELISEISLMFGTYNRENSGSITIELLSNNEVIFEELIDQSKLIDNSMLRLKFKKPMEVNLNNWAVIRVSANDVKDDLSATLWISDQVSSKNQSKLYVNDSLVNGELVFSYKAVEKFPFVLVFSTIVIIFLFLILFLYRISLTKLSQGKVNFIIKFSDFVRRYYFLLKQLVSRDFKTKYRRSFLGVFWSFLNPLLTMIIQYIVFSSIFRSSIENYPVYLLSGIVIFNALSESSNTSLSAIVSNFSLINKVKVPLYVFPISRVFMSLINLSLSLLPLIIVMILTGTPLSYKLIIIPIGLLFLIVFLVGVGLILSTLMVFFRDIQFLWGVFLLVWMYATPIFYPESIIPQRFSMILTFNPIYYYIRFMRSIIIEQTVPGFDVLIPIVFISLLVFFVGLFFFNKRQEQFIYYI